MKIEKWKISENTSILFISLHLCPVKKQCNIVLNIINCAGCSVMAKVFATRAKIFHIFQPVKEQICTIF